MAIKIQLRRGTAANWTSTNPILSDGEVGFESDTGKFKIGRAGTAWIDLAYATDLPSQIDGLLSDLSNTVTSHTTASLNVHGIANTTALETKTGAQAKADAAISSAGTYTDSELYTHNSSILNIHGIANTAALETKTGAQAKADAAESAAKGYADSVVSGLVDSAPTLLNTLNELASALNDDPAFATTVANSIATKATLIVDTSSNLTTANAAIAASTFVLESNTGKFKIGNGTTNWTALPYAGTTSTEITDLTTQLETYANNMMAYHMGQTTEVHGIANVADLVVSSTLTAHTSGTTNVHGIADTASLVTRSDLELYNLDVTNVHGIANTALLLTTSDLTTINNSLDLKAPLANAIFTGTIALPSTTSIGTVSSDELGYLDGVTSLIQDQLNAKLPSSTAATTYAPLADATLTGTVVLPATTSIGNVSGTELSYVDGVTSSIQAQIDSKASTANPTFTGAVSGITKIMVGLANVDNTSDIDKPISTATQAALDLKAPLANATLTGTVVLPATTSIGNVSGTELSYVDGVTSSIQAQLDSKLSTVSISETYAPLNSPAFTGTVSGITKTMVGLASVDNTSDADKPISTATQAALDLKAPLANATLTGTVVLPATTSIGTVSATELGYVDGVTSAIQAQIDTKAPIASPTFTGTVSGITKAMVGLGSVDNTSDASKPISTATQAALDLKAPLANATFTGTLTAADVTITGNLSVTGTTTTVNSQNLAVTDSLIYLAKDQYAADVLDIGIYGAYGSSGNNAGNHPHTGLVRDASDGKWKLISGGAEPTSSEVDFTTAVKDTLVIGALDATSATIGNVSNTELQYLDGVTSSIQTQLNAKAPSESPTLANVTVTGSLALPSGSVTSTMIADGTIVNADISASAAIAVSKLAASTISGVTLGSNLNALTIGTGLTGTSYNGSTGVTVAIDSTVATLTGAQALTNKTITLASGGVTFSDGSVQLVAGVPSITTIAGKTASYTLSALTERDTIIEISSASAATLTIPLDSTLNFPVGTTIDIIQTSTGQVTVAAAGGVTVNATPGLKLRTQWSSATLLKRAANTWLVFGDLSA